MPGEDLPTFLASHHVGVPSKPTQAAVLRRRPGLHGARRHLPAAARAAHNLDVVQAEGHQLLVGVLEADLGDLALVEGGTGSSRWEC